MFDAASRQVAIFISDFVGYVIGSEMQTITKTEALNIVAECCENYESPYNTTAITNPAEKVLGLAINNYFQNRETAKVSDFAAYVMVTLLPAVIDNSLYLGDGENKPIIWASDLNGSGFTLQSFANEYELNLDSGISGNYVAATEYLHCVCSEYDGDLVGLKNRFADGSTFALYRALPPVYSGDFGLQYSDDCLLAKVSVTHTANDIHFAITPSDLLQWVTAFGNFGNTLWQMQRDGDLQHTASEFISY